MTILKLVITRSQGGGEGFPPSKIQMVEELEEVEKVEEVEEAGNSACVVETIN